MGFFGTFLYSDGQWTEHADYPQASTYLRVDIHDSDLAQKDYAPAQASRGRFYLGFEPAIYFEDPDASQPVDPDAEARGFSTWAEKASPPAGALAFTHDDERTRRASSVAAGFRCEVRRSQRASFPRGCEPPRSEHR
jgi:hypothetical protein